VTFYPSGSVVRKNGVAANSTVLIGEDGTNGVVEPPSRPMPSDAGAADASGTSMGGTSMGGTSHGGSMAGTSQGGTSHGGTSMGGATGASAGTASGGDSSAGGSTVGPSPADAGSDAKPANAGNCSCRIGDAASDPRGAWMLT